MNAKPQDHWVNILTREIWTEHYRVNKWTYFWYYISCPSCRTYLWDLRVWEISLIAIITSRCMFDHLVKLFCFRQNVILSLGFIDNISVWDFTELCDWAFKNIFFTNPWFFQTCWFREWEEFWRNRGWALTADDVSPDNMKSISSNCEIFWGAEETRKHTLPWGHMVTGYRVSVLHSTGGEREIFIHSYRPQYQSQAFFIVSNYSYKHVIISLRTFYAILGAKKLFIFCNSKL